MWINHQTGSLAFHRSPSFYHLSNEHHRNTSAFSLCSDLLLSPDYSFPSATSCLISVHPAHCKQWQPQVAHLHQHPMERSLINIGPADDGFPILDIGDGEAVKPLVPLLTEMSPNTNEI